MTHLAVCGGTWVLQRNAEATGRGEGPSIALSASEQAASAPSASEPAEPVRSIVTRHSGGRGALRRCSALSGWLFSPSRLYRGQRPDGRRLLLPPRAGRTPPRQDRHPAHPSWTP